MPAGKLKNTAYALALPLLGKRCEWAAERGNALQKCMHRHHVAGACIQRFEKGKLTESHAMGVAGEKKPVTSQTVFRTASIAKMVTALLVFRMQMLNRLHVQEDISDFLGYQVRNPHCPDAPVTLGMLLSHTSGMVDSSAYFDSFQHSVPLKTLLEDPQAWLSAVPGMHFRYSNLAAGMIGCLLESRFHMSFEALAQQELFEPLSVQATFDVSKVDAEYAADSWRVLPKAHSFDAQTRIAAAKPIEEMDPAQHYLLASGSLFLTAEALAKLTLAAWSGADGFLDEKSVSQMQKPILGWPQPEVRMRHGMGLFELDDRKICDRKLWGHQGFAYGAVNGVFFDAEGNGFASLNSGCSERRIGHLALVNRDLIRLWMKK